MGGFSDLATPPSLDGNSLPLMEAAVVLVNLEGGTLDDSPALLFFADTILGTS